MHAGSDGWGALKEWDCHAHLIPLARRTDTALNRAAPDKSQSAFLSSMNLHLSPSERISPNRCVLFVNAIGVPCPSVTSQDIPNSATHFRRILFSAHGLGDSDSSAG